MKHLTKRVFALILTLAMLLSMVPAVGAADATGSGYQELSFEKTTGAAGVPDDALLVENDNSLEVGETTYAPEDVVRVSIVLESEGTIASGYATKDIASNEKAMAYRASLVEEQEEVTASIESALGETLDVHWNLTLAANIISADVCYGQIETISQIEGVEKVVIETRYEPCVVDETLENDPNMATSGTQIGSTYAWADGYTGAGSRIAVIDTGLDEDHKSFDAAAYEYSMSLLAEKAGMTTEEYMKAMNVLTVDEIASVMSQLNATSKDYSEKATAAELYKTSKVPFGYNYIDISTDYITHDFDSASGHGSHVEGIAAANAYVPDGNGSFVDALDAVAVKGVAPDAQIIVMKVFGKAGGAYDSDYMAAIEDAIVLNCDSINLSLGSASPGFVTNDTYADLLNFLTTTDAVVTMSAGNSGHWAASAANSAPGYLYADDVSTDTVGSPGSYTNSLAVASVDNAGGFGKYFTVGSANVLYNETSYKNVSLSTLAGEQEYIFIDGTGTAEEFAAIGENLKGKVAFCARGTISFFEKANNAVAAGAIATIICNNQAGSINMDLSDYIYTAPCVSITQEEASAIRAASTPVKDAEGNVLYYTGTMTISKEAGAVSTSSAYYTMSSFSSYGVPSDLSMKPEITAPGGNIYSVDGEVSGGAAYTNMSGTSMAAPQVAGMAALVAQFIRDNDLKTLTGESTRALGQSLLMSTAEPIYESEGLYYPILRQGAGLANVGNAVRATSYIMMDESATDSWADGKVKAELGDDPDREGVYTVTFTLNNLTDKAEAYFLSADLFTQGLVSDGTYLYMDNATTGLTALATWTADGKTLTPIASYEDYDVNGDGVLTVADVQLVLDYVVDPTIALANADKADLDGNDKITSYDAYLLLQKVNSGTVTLPANGSVEISVTLALTDEQKAELELDENGSYIEGYIYAKAYSSEEGVEGTCHSIPVLGYYGSWTEPSMFDQGSLISRFYGDTKQPYVSAMAQNYLTLKRADNAMSYNHTGNPYVVEESYDETRNALNPNATIYQHFFSSIRNAAAYTGVAQDGEGNVRYMYAPGSDLFGAYYYTNGQSWQNTGWASTINRTPASMGFKEGETFTWSTVLIPEYYEKLGELNSANVKNMIENGTLGAGAFQSFTFTLDATAPQALHIYRDLQSGDIIVECQDENYVAAVQIQTLNGRVLAQAAATQTEKGGVAKAVIDMSKVKVGTEAVIVVGDYAMNETAYVVELGGKPVDYTGEFYAFTNGSYRGSGNRWINILTDDLWYYNTGAYSGTTTAQAVDMNITAAEYVDGYVFMASTDGYIYVAQQDMWLDAVRASSYTDTTSTILDMAFNYSDKTMYVLDNNNTIYKLDVLTTELTKVGTITMIPNYMTTNAAQQKLSAMTIDDNGNFYAVNYGSSAQSYLYTFTLDQFVNGAITGLTPISGNKVGTTGFYSCVATMAYDHDTDEIYMIGDLFDSGSAYSYLAKLDPLTGIGTKVTNKDGGYGAAAASRMNVNVDGLYIVPSAKAGVIQMVEEASGIALSTDSITGLVGMETAVETFVTNWNVLDKSVTWQSSDPSVATVTNAGRVQMVGVGEAILTATTNAEPKLSTTCKVTVEATPDIALTALRRTETGAEWIDFNTNDLTNATVISEADQAYYSGDVVDNTLYVHNTSYMYGISPDTFTSTQLNAISSDFQWSDAAAAPELNGAFGCLTALALDGTYVTLINPVTGQVPEVFDMSKNLGSDALAVIAFAGSGKAYYSPSGVYMDANFYYAMTQTGKLLYLTIYAYEHSQFGTRYIMGCTSLGNMGIKLTNAARIGSGSYASMVYDADSKYLIISASINGDSNTIYAIQTESLLAIELGETGSEPIVSLYQFERAKDLAVRLSAKETSIYVGNTLALDANVVLSKNDASLVWTSSNPEVATVDENGKITGVSAGTATITATTVEKDSTGKPASASVEISVKALKALDETFGAQIVTTDGKTQWVTIDSASGTYTVDGEGGTTFVAAVGHDNTFVGVNENNQVVTVDPETMEETTWGTFPEDTGVRDMATAPLDEMDICDYWTYEHYDGDAFGFPVAVMDKDNKLALLYDYNKLSDSDLKYMSWGLGIWEIEGVAAITYVGHTWYDTNYEGYCEAKIFYSMGADGRLREFIMRPTWIEYGYSTDLSYNLTAHTIAKTDMTFEDPYGVSMTYVKNEKNVGLILADTNSERVDLYWIDLSADTDYAVEKICTLDGVTSISGLYTEDDLKGTCLNDNYPNMMISAMDDLPNAPYRAEDKFIGEVNSYTGEEVDPSAYAQAEETTAAAETRSIVEGIGEAEAEETTKTLTVTADAETTNGLIVITYDAAEVTLDSYTVKAGIKSVKAEEGKLTFAYVSETAIAKDATLAELTFTVKEGVKESEITATVMEDNDTTPETTSTITLEGKTEPDVPDIPDVPDVPEECPSKIYSDVPVGTWYHEAVDYVTDAGLMNGMGKGAFEPDGTATRAMFATVLWRMSGAPEATNAATFEDVPEGIWFAEAVAWAQEQGIIKGVDETHFGPYETATREQIAVMLWRLAGEPEATAELNFNDADQITSYAREAMEYAVETGLYEGDPEGNLKPKGEITRAELATVLMRLADGSFNCPENK